MSTAKPKHKALEADPVKLDDETLRDLLGALYLEATRRGIDARQVCSTAESSAEADRITEAIFDLFAYPKNDRRA
jgi:hypothetical protein